MVITLVESNPGVRLKTQPTFWFSPSVLARDNKMPIMTMSAASGATGKFSSEQSTFYADSYSVSVPPCVTAVARENLLLMV